MSSPPPEIPVVENPALTIEGSEWAKLIHMLKKPTEVSFMGVAYDIKNPLHVNELVMLKQECTAGFTEFEDEAFQKYLFEQHKLGRQPVQYSRIWVHTHPSGVDQPSGYDESKFKEAFGDYNWAVMLIVTKAQKVYCRIRVMAAGVAVSQEIPVHVSPGAHNPEWDKEYDLKVDTPLVQTGYCQGSGYWRNGEWQQWGREWHDWKEKEEPTTKRKFTVSDLEAREEALDAWADKLLEQESALEGRMEEIRKGNLPSEDLEESQPKDGVGPAKLVKLILPDKKELEIPAGATLSLRTVDMSKDKPFEWYWDGWVWWSEMGPTEARHNGYFVEWDQDDDDDAPLSLEESV